jgi:hypothetical protein
VFQVILPNVYVNRLGKMWKTFQILAYERFGSNVSTVGCGLEKIWERSTYVGLTFLISLISIENKGSYCFGTLAERGKGRHFFGK